MKLFRYRRPSLRTVLGYTAAVRRVKHQLGMSQVHRWTSTSRVRQRAKQHLGYYAPATRVVRNAAQDSFPSFLGVATRSPTRVVRGRHRAS